MVTCLFHNIWFQFVAYSSHISHIYLSVISVITVYSVLIIFNLKFCIKFTLYHLHPTGLCTAVEAFSYCSKYWSAWGMFSIITVHSILIIFLMYNSVLSLPSTHYALCYMFYHRHSILYVLPATLFNLRSTLYDLPSKPICLEGYWNFLIFFF